MTLNWHSSGIHCEGCVVARGALSSSACSESLEAGLAAASALHFPRVSSGWLRVPAKNVVRLLLENIKYLHLEVKNRLFFFNAVFEGMKKGRIVTKDSSKICRSQVPPRVITNFFWLNLGDLNVIPIPSFLHLAQRDKIENKWLLSCLWCQGRILLLFIF